MAPLLSGDCEGLLMAPTRAMRTRETLLATVIVARNFMIGRPIVKQSALA